MCLTGEHVLCPEAQVSPRGVSLEMDPQFGREDHNWKCRDGLSAEFGQQLSV